MSQILLNIKHGSQHKIHNDESLIRSPHFSSFARASLICNIFKKSVNKLVRFSSLHDFALFTTDSDKDIL